MFLWVCAAILQKCYVMLNHFQKKINMNLLHKSSIYIKSFYLLCFKKIKINLSNLFEFFIQITNKFFFKLILLNYFYFFLCYEKLTLKQADSFLFNVGVNVLFRLSRFARQCTSEDPIAVYDLLILLHAPVGRAAE